MLPNDTTECDHTLHMLTGLFARLLPLDTPLLTEDEFLTWI
jgi:hypothetical protein